MQLQELISTPIMLMKYFLLERRIGSILVSIAVIKMEVRNVVMDIKLKPVSFRLTNKKR